MLTTEKKERPSRRMLRQRDPFAGNTIPQPGGVCQEGAEIWQILVQDSMKLGARFNGTWCKIQWIQGAIHTYV